jgi:hypothetical protein
MASQARNAALPRSLHTLSAARFGSRSSGATDLLWMKAAPESRATERRKDSMKK